MVDPLPAISARFASLAAVPASAGALACLALAIGAPAGAAAELDQESPFQSGFT